jgi:excinuclease ABC subunit C
VRTTAGNDDFAALYEVLSRRFKRYSDQREKDADSNGDGRTLGARALASVPLRDFDPERELPVAAEEVAGSDKEWGMTPDLVLIDGGKGQLNAVREVFAEFGIDAAEIPLAAIAKQREELFLPGRAGPVLLPNDSSGLHLIQRVRDEAHRFAVSFHIKLRTQKGRRSILDEIPSIGPKRKRALLREFGSLKRIRDASANDLAAVPGMTAASAKALKEAL